MIEIVAPVIQLAHFNHFQMSIVLNHTGGIIRKGRNANPQFSQLLTILQVEFTARILIEDVLVL